MRIYLTGFMGSGKTTVGRLLARRLNAPFLDLDSEIGTLAQGSWADLVVLDSKATPALAHRVETAARLEDELFALMILGDDRAVRATYVQGRLSAHR